MHTSKLTSQYSTLDDTISKQVVITGDQTTCQINSLTETTNNITEINKQGNMAYTVGTEFYL